MTDTDDIVLTEPDLHVERLWGLPAIADFLDVSVSTARRLSRKGAPIFKPAGKYYAIRSELWRWSRATRTL